MQDNLEPTHTLTVLSLPLKEELVLISVIRFIGGAKLHLT
jgi:hypothetical protein